MDPQPPEGLSSRDRILWAAASMLGQATAEAPSVRAVAARAGVSTGSLRHHFPTQRELMSAMLARVYDTVLPDKSIHDSSIPPRERLIASLQSLLAPESISTTPRDAWRLVFERYIASEPTPAARAEYLAIDREMRRRIEYALTVLQDEGAIPPGDNPRRARFLATVTNGLSIAQALPAEDAAVVIELDMLRAAVDFVLADRA